MSKQHCWFEFLFFQSCCIVTMHFEKFFQSALNLGPSHRTLKKKYFFSKCINISHINALWKNFENQILHGLLMNWYLIQIFYQWFYLLYVHLSRFWSDICRIGWFVSCKFNFCIDSVNVFLTHLLLLDIFGQR